MTILVELKKRKPNVIFTDCLKAIDCLVKSCETSLQKAAPQKAAKLSPDSVKTNKLPST
jgi:hypothetical protein